MNRVRLTTLVLAAGSLVVAPASPLFAQSPSPPAAVSVASSVATFYQTYKSQPVWFRDGAESAAVAQLISILQRAPFDGFAAGPQLAQEVQTAAAQARSGGAAAIAAAERTLSAAWVQYVQAIKRPTPGMIYVYPVLQPQGSRADQILLTAAAAPSLEQHLAAVAAVNPIYSAIRDAAWAEARASGNLTPDPRLIANLERARTIPAKGRFLLVDSATQRLTLWDNGQPVDSMKVIVGTKDMPTPLIASVMYYITFNPYWNAPDHLVRKAIAPNALRQGKGYLSSRGYQVMADWTDAAAVVPPENVDWKAVAAGKVKIRVRQDPGKGNFMGELKFPFPNPEDIFLHDTPNKALFSKAQRDLSNGCVRVEDARRLGFWLLGREPVAPSSTPEIDVQLPRPLPIYLTYITAQVRDGKVAYLPDIYGWDRITPRFAASR